MYAVIKYRGGYTYSKLHCNSIDLSKGSVDIVGIGATKDEARNGAIYYFEDQTFNGVDSYIEVAKNDERVNNVIEFSPELEIHYRNFINEVPDDGVLTDELLEYLINVSFWVFLEGRLFVKADGKLGYACLVIDNFNNYVATESEIKESYRNHHKETYTPDPWFDKF